MDVICYSYGDNDGTIQAAFNAACKTGHEHCAMILIESGADVNAVVSKGKTALYIAAERMKYDLMKALINAGADVYNSPPALMAAADLEQDNAEQFVNLLIEAGADVNMTNRGGYTALMTAAWRAASPNIITALVNAGADVNARDSCGQCAIAKAADRNFVKGLELLIEAADKTDPTQSYLPPLSDIASDIPQLA